MNPSLVKKLFDDIKPPVDTVNTPWLEQAGIQMGILRLDRIHPLLSGNKWYKLKHHLVLACSSPVTRHVISFGGAWSNHIHALAAAGFCLNIPVTGIIRGEPAGELTATLQDAKKWGMNLVFVNRTEYKKRHDPDYQHHWLQQCQLSSNQVLFVPEGGSGKPGVKGCEDILKQAALSSAGYAEIWVACGTGATAAGIIRSTPEGAHVRAVSVLKGGQFLKDNINQYLSSDSAKWSLETEEHCGGYAKVTRELMTCMSDFEQETGILTDPVYTGKVLLAIQNHVKKGLIKRGTRLLMIHTGGLQGRRGWPELG